MSDKLFNEKEIEVLSQNRYVKKVSTKGITYTDEFKRIFIIENERGKTSRQIFADYGLEVDILAINRIRSSGKRWRKSCKKDGVLGLQDTRIINSGRPSTKELSIEEKYERLTAQNNLLKVENELLKKIDLMERRQIKMTLEEYSKINYNLKRIRRIMKKYNIYCPIRRANPYKRMMKATREHSGVPNILNRKFKQNIPGKVLLTDITYLFYGNGKKAS